MKETIYTIPLSEVFEPLQGCPLCRLKAILEERALEAIMGAAMMEPDIRIQTNRAGFCAAHFDKMLARKNRLSLALMLESHLDAIGQLLPGETQENAGKADVKRLRTALESCYICEKVETSLSQMVRNLFEVYRREEEFRALYARQPHLCLEHYCLLAEGAPKELGKKELGGFLAVTGRLARQGLREAREDIGAFCALFDYRNAGKSADNPRVKTAVERAVGLLTGSEQP